MHNATGVSRAGRDSEGRVVERPLSPHLQIYRPQITSVLSISHRITGIALSVGTLLLTWWLTACAGGPATFAAMQGFMGSPLGMLLLFGWSVALFYHFCAGLRHLVWDAGYGYSLPAVYRSGYAVLAGTAALTLLTWIVGLWLWGHR